MKICPKCSTIHALQEKCPPLVKCPSCSTMYRQGKGCLVCVLFGNHMPSAGLIFNRMQDEPTTAQEPIQWIYDDGNVQIGVARQDAVVTDEMHLYAEPIREQNGKDGDEEMQRMRYQPCSQCGRSELCVNDLCARCEHGQLEPEEHRDDCDCSGCQRARFNQLELLNPWRCRPVPAVFYKVFEKAGEQ